MSRSEAYGWDHQRDRAAWNAELEASGPRPCPRCPALVYPDSLRHLNPDGRKFHLGHRSDVALGGKDGPKTPEHDHCNTSAGATLGNKLRAKRRRRTMRDW